MEKPFQDYRADYDRRGTQYRLSLYEASGGSWLFYVYDYKGQLLSKTPTELERFSDGDMVYLREDSSICAVGDDVEDALRELMDYIFYGIDFMRRTPRSKRSEYVKRQLALLLRLVDLS